jgi:hypothetical protein
MSDRNSITILAYFAGMSHSLMKKVLDRIYVSFASHRDEFAFARTIDDVNFPILMEDEQRVIVEFLFRDGLDAH